MANWRHRFTTPPAARPGFDVAADSNTCLWQKRISEGRQIQGDQWLDQELPTYMESILLSTHYGEGRRPAVSKNDTPPSSCKHGGRMHPPPHPHGTCGRRRRGGTVTPDRKARGAPTGVIPALLQPEQDLGGSRGPSMRGRWIWTEFLCPPPTSPSETLLQPRRSLWKESGSEESGA